ncbi:hypothetical protein HDV57DRAFT_53374 [Trichoderma longibrachiatum]
MVSTHHLALALLRPCLLQLGPNASPLASSGFSSGLLEGLPRVGGTSRSQLQLPAVCVPRTRKHCQRSPGGAVPSTPSPCPSLGCLMACPRLSLSAYRLVANLKRRKFSTHG